MTKTLAVQLGRHGITVNCIHPGTTRTERTPSLLAARAAQLGVSPEEAERQDFAPDSPRAAWWTLRRSRSSPSSWPRIRPGRSPASWWRQAAEPGGLYFTKRRSDGARPNDRPGPPRPPCLGRRHDPGADDARSRPSRRHERASRPACSSPHPTTLCRYSWPEVCHLPRPPAD
jgi:hypothetical protein